MVSRLSNIRPILRVSLSPQYNLAKGLEHMSINNRDYYWNEKIAKNISDKYFTSPADWEKINPNDENVWEKLRKEAVRRSNRSPGVAVKEPPTPPEEPTITLQQSNERVKGAYRAVVAYLQYLSTEHKKKASAVNIFDTVRLVEIGNSKVCDKAAASIQDFINDIENGTPAELMPFPHIEN